MPPGGESNSAQVADFDTSAGYATPYSGKSGIGRMLRYLLSGVSLSLLAACPGWAQTGCPALSNPVSRVESGFVELSWQHPCALVDTCRGGEGPATGAAFVEPNAAHGRMAIRLPGEFGGRVVTEIAAYYREVNGASAEEWATSGPMSWSIWADSQGGPGKPESEFLEVSFGSDPNLRIGGVRTDTCRLPIPPGGAWLVASWPQGPEIVQLGTNSPSPGGYILMGYADEAGPQWVPLCMDMKGVGLAVQAVLIDPDSLDCLRGGLARPTQTLILQDGAGTKSEVCDTIVLPWDATAYRDSCLCPGELRVYRAAYTCCVADGETVGFDTIAVPRACSSRVEPLSISAFIAPGGQLPSLSVRNLSPDSLIIAAGFPADLAPASPESDTLCRVWGYPAQAVLAPYDSVEVALQLSSERPTAGDFRGSIALTVSQVGVGLDQYCIPVRVAFDPPVWVPTEPVREPESPQSAKLLTAWCTQDADGCTSIRVIVDAAFMPGAGCSSSPGEVGFCRVHVVNILGQEMAAVKSTLSGARFVDRDQISAVIEIEGSETWPSGVYPCRVSMGNVSAAFPIVIVR